MSSPTPRSTLLGSIRLEVGALAVALFALACNEPTRPTAGQLPTAGSSRAQTGDPGTDKPLGIGGSYTLNVSGPYVTERYPSPSGITLIPGIPVEVIVSGQITRQMTDGFISHCELFPYTCPGFVKSNEPFGPGGLEFTNLGAATSWWDNFIGYYYYVSPGGSVVYRGLSGTNLLLGRTGLYCSWGHVFGDGAVEEGDCYSMGGGFTYTVRARPTPPGAAGLTLALANGALSAGSQVDLQSGTTDGSEATDLKWYFIADNVKEETDPAPPVMAAAGASTMRAPLSASRAMVATRAPNAGARRAPALGRRVRAIDARTGSATITTDISTLPAGDYLFLSADSTGVGMDGAHAATFADAPTSPAAMRMSAPSKASASRLGAPTTRASALVAAAITGSATLGDCAGAITCSANLQVAGGTFVVTGNVHGVLRVAEQRVSGGGGGNAAPTASCAPSPIERGASITCMTTGFKVVGKWTFTPSASNLPTVSEVVNRVDHEWKGNVVADGTVTVDGWEKVADFPDESKKTSAAPFVVQVAGRAWKDTKLQLPGLPRFGGAGPLPDGPAGGIYTWGVHQLQSPDFSGVGVLSVTAGPNAGYKILTAPPTLTQSVVYLNPALDGTSAWAKKQTGRYKGQTRDVNGDPICTTAALALLKPHVEQHEGLTGAPAPDSHWGIWQDQFGQSGLNTTWESLVRSDDSLPSEMVKAYNDFVTGPAATAAQAALDARDNDAVQKGWAGGCLFIP